MTPEERIAELEKQVQQLVEAFGRTVDQVVELDKRTTNLEHGIECITASVKGIPDEIVVKLTANADRIVELGVSKMLSKTTGALVDLVSWPFRAAAKAWHKKPTTATATEPTTVAAPATA